MEKEQKHVAKGSLGVLSQSGSGRVQGLQFQREKHILTPKHSLNFTNGSLKEIYYLFLF